MTLQSPFVLWDVSFQISFAATLGPIVMATPLSRAWQQWLTRRIPIVATCPGSGLWPGARSALTGCRMLLLFAGGDLMVSAVATLATLPILLYDFHNLSVLSLPVNLLVLPAQPPIMATGFFVILGGLVHPVLGQFFGWLAWPFLVWTTAIVEGVAAGLDRGEQRRIQVWWIAGKLRHQTSTATEDTIISGIASIDRAGIPLAGFSFHYCSYPITRWHCGYKHP